MRRVSLPDQSLLDAVGPLPDGVVAHPWDLTGPPPDPGVQYVVLPYQGRRRLEVLGRLADLQAVQTLSNGYDHLHGRLPRGVALYSGAGIHDAATAELALAITLASLRGVDEAVLAQREGTWRREQRQTSLVERRALVVGWGGVGQEIARRLDAFGVPVTAVASRARQEGGRAVHGVEELPRLLPRHDVVLIATPLVEATRGMVGADFLATMPDGALLVNVARGPVVRTNALLVELTSGRLRAALDVTDPEPLPDGHPLWHAPGVLITPHIAGGTDAWTSRAVALLRDQLARLAAGQPLRNLVQPAA